MVQPDKPFVPEPEQTAAPDQLDRQFWSIRNFFDWILANIPDLSANYFWTGQHTFDVGDSPNYPSGDVNIPVILKAGLDGLQPTTEIVELIRLDGTWWVGAAVAQSGPILSFVNSVEAGGIPTLRIGSIGAGEIMNLELVSAPAQGIIMGSDAVFSDPHIGVRFRDRVSGLGNQVILPDEPIEPVVRFDLYSEADLDSPFGIASSRIETMMWHGSKDVPAEKAFSFQLIMGTAEDYNETTYPESDPVVVIRAGAPAPTDAWNGDWLNFLILDLSDIDPNDPDPSKFAGYAPYWDYDPPSYPNNGRWRVRANSLENLTDTVITTPQLYDQLVFDGDDWVNVDAQPRYVNWSKGLDTDYDPTDIITNWTEADAVGLTTNPAAGTITIGALDHGVYQFNLYITFETGNRTVHEWGVYLGGVLAVSKTITAGQNQTEAVLSFPVAVNAATSGDIDVRYVSGPNTDILDANISMVRLIRTS